MAGIKPHTTYRAALEFKRRFDLGIDRAASRSEEHVDVIHEHARLTLALRRLDQSAGGVDRVGSASTAEAATAAALAVTQGRAHSPRTIRSPTRSDAFCAWLTSGIAGAATPDTMVVHVADCLKRAVPTRSVKLIEANAPFIHRTDAVHFDVPATDGGSPDRLLVEFARGCRLEPWHLQYLKAAAQLLAVVRETSRLRALPVEEQIDVPSGWKRIVVRYLDGRLVKGFCDEFSPATGQVQVSATPNSTRESRVIVSLKQLKAVFFVHDLEGGAARQGAQNPREAGRRIDVTFVDGELLSGTTLSYSRDGVGFFVYPADAHSNNSRTFVVSAAVRHVQFP